MTRLYTARLLPPDSGHISPTQSFLANYLPLMYSKHKIRRKQNLEHFNLEPCDGRSDLCALFGELALLLVACLIQNHSLLPKIN